MDAKTTNKTRIDTRKSPRYQTTLLARVDGEVSLFESRGNVSAGGFCFESDRELEPGQLVDLLIRLPGAGFWLSARGVVLGCVYDEKSVFVRGRFIAIDAGDAGQLQEWIGSIRPRQAQAA